MPSRTWRPSLLVKYIPSALSRRRGLALNWRLAVKGIQKSSRLLDILSGFGAKAFVIMATRIGKMGCCSDFAGVYV
ncbi:hypothetical protein D3C80_2134950 [compost metagenome]